MATRDTSSFKSTKNARFPDNTTGAVTAVASRNMYEDVADSFVNKTDDIIDEDDMASDSDTKVPTQQSVKAYVDNKAGGSANPSTRFVEVDDFIVGLVGATSSTSTNFYGATSGPGGSGTASSDYRMAEDHTFGVIGAIVDTAAARSQWLKAGFMWGNGNVLSIKFRAAIGALSDANDEFIAKIGVGIGVNSSDGPTSGIFFRYTHSVNSGKWQAITRDSSDTATDTEVTADTAFHEFEIIVNADASSVEFKIDGATVATNTTNIPDGTSPSTQSVWLAIEAGSTIDEDRAIYGDWCIIQVTNESGR